jgi:glycosyltransferase involved in cell wall biosynthesis
MQSISVVIPVHNGRRFIVGALESVERQSLAPLEMIVIDDGSTDETGREIDAFTATIPVICLRQEQRGAGAARNTGAALARGEWLAFLDADDLWHPDKLATQIEYAEHHPDLGFFYSDVDLIDETGEFAQRRWATREFVEKKLNSRQRLSRIVFDGRPFPLPSTVFMKRQLFERTGGFNTAFGGKYHEDFEFFARLAEVAPLYFIPRSLARHRGHSSQPDAGAEMDRQNWLLFLDCLWEIWQRSPLKQATLARYYGKHYGDEGKRCLRTGDYEAARRYCRLAAAYDPLGFTNLRHWGLALLPGAREFYSARAGKRKS